MDDFWYEMSYYRFAPKTIQKRIEQEEKEIWDDDVSRPIEEYVICNPDLE